jgi:flagellar biosynthetic protein FlhB
MQQAGERTEQATPRRKQELREKGQIARSPEVSSAASLIGALLAVKFFAGHISHGLNALLSDSLGRTTIHELTPTLLQEEALSTMLAMAKIIAPVAIAAAIGGAAGGVAQVGFLVTMQPLKPDFTKLNPFTGVARLFSLQALAQLTKSLLKAGIVGYVLFTFLRGHWESVLALHSTSPWKMGPIIGTLLWGLMIRGAAAIAIIAALDYIYQRFQFDRRTRMTKQEVKEEYKRTEGDPLIRSSRRRRQRELVRQRMLQAVAQATVVVTNPIHLAVALRSEPGEMAAPKVLAKGKRLMAGRIKELARKHNIPVVENVPLAQALYKNVKVGGFVPADLYQAVAEVIAFVYRLAGKTSAGNWRG